MTVAGIVALALVVLEVVVGELVAVGALETDPPDPGVPVVVPEAAELSGLTGAPGLCRLSVQRSDSRTDDDLGLL